MFFYQHAATRSHSSGRKWLQVAAPREWPQVAASGRSKRVAASGRKWPPQTVPSKWPQVAAPSEWPQVATFCDFNFHPQSNLPGFLQNRKDFEAC